MIADKLEEINAPASYGLMETVGRGRTDIDQSDGEDEYFELCAKVYGDSYVRVYTGKGKAK